MTFLHGPEIIEKTSGSRPIRTVRSAVIGLVGTAPMWAVAEADRTLNTPVVIRSDRDAEKYFGPASAAGYTIPAAIRAAQAQGAATIIVVNVLDLATHKAAVVAAEFVLPASDIVQLPDVGVQSVVVKDSTGATTYDVDVDYTLNSVKGTVTRLAAGDIDAGATIKINYDRPDPTAVTGAEVIGTVEAGVRSGAQAWLDASALLGFAPKILIAPGYASVATVATALTTLATTLRAIALIDAAAGTTVANAIAYRGTVGQALATASDRVVLCYPHVKTSDGAGGIATEPLSQWLAGLIAATDETEGFWVSPSNQELRGLVGLERPLTSDGGTTSEINALNEQGITTLAARFGGGIRAWGNRSAAFPAAATPNTFFPVRRVADLISDSLEMELLNFIDRPITPALIDAITNSVNAYIRTLVGRGALIDGRCTYDPAKNADSELALGHLCFDLGFMPPPPAERITFETTIDTTLLRGLNVAQGA